MNKAEQGAAMDAAGFVLAGGRSSRMGSDKALVEFAGEPLLAHTLGIFRAVGLPVAIAGARSPLEAFAPVVPDATPDCGPLGGICSAMASTAARWSVFLSVDLPLIPPAVIQYLIACARSREAGVTVARVNGFTETFPVVVDRLLLPELRAAFDAGRSGCYAELRAAAEALGRPVCAIDLEEAVRAGKLDQARLPIECWFVNTNTKEELARAESYWRDCRK